MSIVAVLAAAVIFVAVFRVPLQRCPAVFYAAALAFDALLLLGQQFDVPVVLWRAALTFHSRCLFAFALFAIVMFVGVLKDGSWLKRALMPVRAELSLVASFLALGHALNFAGLYVNRALVGGLDSAFVAATVAALLLALLVPLAVTSLKAVKRRMAAVRWKNVQRFAYGFWGLVFVHVLAVLGSSALAGAVSARESLAVYVAVFALYLALRLRRLVIDRREVASAITLRNANF